MLLTSTITLWTEFLVGTAGLANGSGGAVLVGDYLDGSDPADQKVFAAEFKTGR